MPVCDSRLVDARPAIEDLPACHGAPLAASPARMAAAAALAGAPAARFRRVLYAECGSGVGISILAAALAGTGVRVSGAARDPREAAAARALLAAAGLEAEIAATGPEALDEGPELEPDLVLLPYGWDLLDVPARRGLADFLARRLASGGGLLLVRDAPPGEPGAEFLRRLAANRFAAAGGTEAAGADRAEAARAALADVEPMLSLCHRALRSLPGWRADLEAARALPPDLIERLWLSPRGPVWSMREMAAWAERAGLARSVPADPLRLVRRLDYTPEQLALIDAAPDPWTAGEAAELIAQRSRRGDLFLKPGGAPAQAGALRLVAAPGASAERLEVAGHLGSAMLSRAVHQPVLDAAARPGGATLEEIAASRKLDRCAALDAVCALIGAGALAPSYGAAPGDAAGEASARLNALLLARPGVSRFASPLLGGPVPARGALLDRWRRQSVPDDPWADAPGSDFRPV